MGTERIHHRGHRGARRETRLTRTPLRSSVLSVVNLLMSFILASAARADVGVPPPLRDVRIEEHLGTALPRAAALRQIDGTPVALGSFFDGRRPVVLTLFYTRCPMLCGLVLDGTARAIRGSARRLGVDYRAVSLSIDPNDTPDAIAARRTALALPEHAADDAWTFLRGDEHALRAVADALGFAYRYDAAARQYAHPAVAFVLTPDGRISRYLYGFDPTPAALDAALAAAAAGQVGQGGIQQLLLQCYRYVPVLRRHAGAVRALLAGGGALILLGVGGVWITAVYTRRRAEVDA
jgi:protein SCO1/2